ncbi:glycerophosphodiester phosphodiesterase family protein [Sandaracinobacteroides hominis]|uniref:glycerophosphodiester phosphodiesterase family protein n=1 Tax=Sandaracinobacteroides hominis TaxID=2780086 RepID=UPI0018F655D1|nr:glycerophosphodiester phosphodiesterase family protein [Sandaracinobacteroides hominis]
MLRFVPMAPLVPLFLLGGCAVGAVQTQRPTARPMPQLHWLFDCLRTNRFALVAAHRAQPNPEATENSVESGTETFRKGITVLEIDVFVSSDGVPMLLHDDTLDRTTTGTGVASQKSYKELRQLQLRKPNGDITEQRIPTLDEALVMARRGGAILMLDPKRSMPMEDLVQHVRSARMEGQVILIANSLAESRLAMGVAPEMMVSTYAREGREAQALMRLANPMMLRFTGTTEPDPALIATLDASRVEAITGTLGKPGERLDDKYQAADDDGLGYARLAERGVTLISSDQPVSAWKALKEHKRDGTWCLTGDSR